VESEPLRLIARTTESDSVYARNRFWAVLLLATAVRLLLAAVAPLSGDEAYYWDCSRHLDWAYFDQPPLVIWAMIPFRMLFGETALAVRMPAILASFGLGVCLPPLARRLGGGYREAMYAYLWACAMPLFQIGSFYASTDIAMSALFVAATWSAVALAQGDARAWWGFAVAIGLGFLAKFPAVLALFALVPALFNPDVRRQLRTPTPWLAALLAILLTLPVWIWAVQHGWDNIEFQLQVRQDIEPLGVRHLAKFVVSSVLVASPPLFVAMAVVWCRALARSPPWKAVAFGAAAPFVVFGLVSLRTHVGAHWGGPGLVLGALLLAMMPAPRPRRALACASAAFSGLVTVFVLVVVLFPAQLLRADWTRNPPFDRIRTKVLQPLLGDQKVVRRIERLRRPDEFVASESYPAVHQFSFLSERQELPFLLADVNDGKHGLASLYWHTPAELEGRNVLFVTRSTTLTVERLTPYFDRVDEIAPIEITRNGEVIRHYRVFRGTGLRNVVPAFSRLGSPGQ
jgi:4-amino-4-deoxy-L-arabinose transferase-like glycosyltransferase